VRFLLICLGQSDRRDETRNRQPVLAANMLFTGHDDPPFSPPSTPLNGRLRAGHLPYLTHELHDHEGCGCLSACKLSELKIVEPSSEPRGCSIRLRLRPGRECYHSIMLDPAQGKLDDAPVHKEACELGLGRVR